MAMVDAAMDRFGRIDVLINNAAMFSETSHGGPFTDVTIAEWDRDLRGERPRRMAVYQGGVPPHGGPGLGQDHQHRLQYVLQGKRSASPITWRASPPCWASPGAWPTSWVPREITVNTVSPDLIPNPDLRPTDATSDPFVVSGRAIRRTQVADDMVGTIIYLSSAASDFVTGQSLLVNGGAFFL